MNVLLSTTSDTFFALCIHLFILVSFIMNSWKFTFLFLLALVTTCSASTIVPFATIDKGEYSGIEFPLNKVYRTATEFANFWTQHRSKLLSTSSSNNPADTIPNVDFSKEMVIAVCMGMRNSGGFHIEITSVDRGDINVDNVDENTLAVNFVTSAPSSSMATTMALTQPYHIIRLDVPHMNIPNTLSDDDLKIVFVGSHSEEQQPQPPLSTMKFIITVSEDADKDAIRSEIEKLAVVTNVEVMSSLPFLFVDLDMSGIGKIEAMELLQGVKGVNTIEADS